MENREEIRLDLKVKELIMNTLKSGFPFMIYDTHFSGEDFIYEYPNGSMKLMQLSEDQRSAIEIRTLTDSEVALIRKKIAYRVSSMPELFLITGPNGVGKSLLYKLFKTARNAS